MVIRVIISSLLSRLLYVLAMLGLLCVWFGDVGMHQKFTSMIIFCVLSSLECHWLTCIFMYYGWVGASSRVLKFLSC